ncbi:fumarylacetoacetate hydrolase family protein [Afifella sp. IM 167]|uniref:fumarylacetoacetate hydrolase family protein n=1 Tax=Afifella sp. IM 167 TaxID=2033586 RepID=UPI001CCA9983|nr:fumarylacetoacetate hydrolase family protein [Afifella sp. IM 167]MBZ8131953.1 2-hydroxyhepta-2,4-diene-1,7-dioate isomerase [Afifella sp. IM 167]
MRLAARRPPNRSLAFIEGDRVFDFRATYALYLDEVERNRDGGRIASICVPEHLNDFIRLHQGSMRRFEGLAAYAGENAERLEGYGLAEPLATARLFPANPLPRKIVCCGNSYARYLREWGLPEDEWPQDVKISFLKSPASLIGHGDTIEFPPDSEQWDYENELAIVIGSYCSDVSEKEAPAHIFGYTVLNDACVRDIPSWTGRYDSPRGKALDTMAPLGPCITPSEYLGRSPNDLEILTKVDGEVRQHDRTSGLLWPIERIVSFVSRYMTLEPGDILATGSTSGNALVCGKWLKEGQSITCEIEGIGTLENKIGVRRWRDMPAKAA